jgi:hypothetical protein
MKKADGRQRSPARRGSKMDTLDQHALTGRCSWKETLLAVLPLLSFMLVMLPRGPLTSLFRSAGLGSVFQVLLENILYAAILPQGFYWLVLAGLVFAWKRNVPRWSYPYLGWLGVVILFGGIRNPAAVDPSPWLVWQPLFLALLVAVLVHPSIKPIQQSWWNWRKDWSLISFALLSMVEFFVWASYDEMPGPRLFWMISSAVILILGALGYLRLRTVSGRILALFGSTALSILLATFVGAFYWDGVVVSYRAGPVDGTQTLWGGLLFTAIVLAVLLLPAGIARLLNRLDPQPGIS